MKLLNLALLFSLFYIRPIYAMEKEPLRSSNPIEIPTKNNRYLKPQKNRPGQEDPSPEKMHQVNFKKKEPLILLCMANMELFSPNGNWYNASPCEEKYQLPK